MSNWFENNAAKSVIGYTLIIAGTTWAASTFILKDNRLGLVQSQLESQKSLTEQYKSKAELLQRDLEVLRSENAEYRQWLGQIKDAIPAVVPRITELKNNVARLEAEAATLRAENPSASSMPSEDTATLGSAFIDKQTGLILTLKDTTPLLMATVIIHFPESRAPIEETIAPGKRWDFSFKGKKYRLIITRVTFIIDSVSFRIEEIS